MRYSKPGFNFVKGDFDFLEGVFRNLELDSTSLDSESFII